MRLELLLRTGLAHGLFCLARCRLFLARHAQNRENINYLILVDEMHALGMQPNKMGAIFPVLFAHAGIKAEEISIRAIDAFPHRNANLGYRYFAGVADSEEVITGRIFIAILRRPGFLIGGKNFAAHKNVRLDIAGFYVIQAFIHPVNAIFTMFHRAHAPTNPAFGRTGHAGASGAAKLRIR
jgi:hypothetical protein